MRLSVFTACTPWLPLADLVPAVAAAGYDGIEIGLRTRQFDAAKKPDFWGNNPAMLDWQSAEAEARELRRRLDAAGLACPCVGSYAEVTDLDKCATSAAVAGILGAPLVRARLPGHKSDPGFAAQFAACRSAFASLAEVAAQHGTRFAIELHDHSLCPSASAALRMLDGLDERRFSVILDVANTVAEGNEALPMVIDMLGDRLQHIHVKDVTVSTREVPYRYSRVGTAFAPLGTGVIDWPGVVACLAASGYAGWLSVENFTGIERGPERLAHDAQWVRRLSATPSAAVPTPGSPR
jgi:sugar phosphate isomerase/epimerase